MTRRARVQNERPIQGFTQQSANPGNAPTEIFDDVRAVPSVLPVLLTSAQVKVLLRIGDRALFDYDRRGWLHPVRVGRQKLYHAAEVEQLLINGTPKSARKNKR